MRSTLAIILAACLGLFACNTERANVEACEAYLLSIEAVSWSLQRTSSPVQQLSTPPALPEEFVSSVDLEEVDFLWFENTTGDSGVCAVHVPSRCACAFFVYRGKAVDQSPSEITISSCGTGL